MALPVLACCAIVRMLRIADSRSNSCATWAQLPDGTPRWPAFGIGRPASLESGRDGFSHLLGDANEVVIDESPTGGLTTVAYNRDGDVLSSVDPDGHEITYAYDADHSRRVLKAAK